MLFVLAITVMMLTGCLIVMGTHNVVHDTAECKINWMANCEATAGHVKIAGQKDSIEGDKSRELILDGDLETAPDIEIEEVEPYEILD